MTDADTITSDKIDLILADQDRLASARSSYEPVWRDIDRYVDPFGAGGFNKSDTLSRDAEDLYDVTAVEGLGRYQAVIAGITMPLNQRWHGVTFADKELLKLPAVQRWCAHAADRLFMARYAAGTGFETQALEDIRQEGKYGTSPMWIGEKLGKGLFYKTLHMSEVFVDEDYCGQIDRVHRLYEATIRNAADEFGLDNLSDRTAREWADPKKRHNKIQILHVVRPNRDFEDEQILGVKGKRFESIYIEVAEKHVLRRSGFHTMPIPTSRIITGPRDIYGLGPAMMGLATVKGLQVMGRTILDGANRAVDPPLLYNDDADITKVVTRPGGLTAGGVNENGKPMVVPLHTGEDLPVGMELVRQEREVVDRIFLGEYFRLLRDPSDRMTATQVLEQVAKEGVLVRPYAARRETEKFGPMIARELDIMMRAKAIDPLPAEVIEAGAKPIPDMTNPLSRMARAEEVSAFTRWVEIGVQAAGAGRPDALERINFDEGMKNAADVLGVRPTSVYSDDELAERRAVNEEKEAATAVGQVAPQVAGAALDLAKANEISQQLAQGGGL